MRFDHFAHFYDAYAVPQRAFAGRVADFLKIRPGEAVLELGAGTGALTQHLAGAGGRVQATDASPRMVERGRAAVPQAGWSVLDAFAGEVPACAIQVSSGLLQWAPDPLRALARWKRALAQGGRMVHAMPCEPCLKEWRELVPESPVMWRDQPGWLQLFEQVGLQALRSELWTLELTHASALEMLRALHRSGVTGKARLTAGELRRAVKAYDAAHSRGSAGVVSTWAWLAVEARNE